MLWNGNLLPPHEIVLRAEGWLFEFQRRHKAAVKRTNREVQKWWKPEVGWVKCNFDGKWFARGLWGGNS